MPTLVNNAVDDPRRGSVIRRLVDYQRATPTRRLRKDGTPQPGHLSDGEMAELLGIARSSWNSLRNGRYGLTVRILREAIKLDASLADFLFSDDPA